MLTYLSFLFCLQASDHLYPWYSGISSGNVTFACYSVFLQLRDIVFYRFLLLCFFPSRNPLIHILDFLSIYSKSLTVLLMNSTSMYFSFFHCQILINHFCTQDYSRPHGSAQNPWLHKIYIQVGEQTNRKTNVSLNFQQY